MPKELCEKYEDLVPKHCGIISVDVTYPEWMCGGAMVKAKHYRIAKHDKTKRMPTEREKMNFMRLGCMRIWSLKAHNNKTLMKAE